MYENWLWERFAPPARGTNDRSMSPVFFFVSTLNAEYQTYVEMPVIIDTLLTDLPNSKFLSIESVSDNIPFFDIPLHVVRGEGDVLMFPHGEYQGICIPL